jgi:hypothetical protein
MTTNCLAKAALLRDLRATEGRLARMITTLGVSELLQKY